MMNVGNIIYKQAGVQLGLLRHVYLTHRRLMPHVHTFYNNARILDGIFIENDVKRPIQEATTHVKSNISAGHDILNILIFHTS